MKETDVEDFDLYGHLIERTASAVILFVHGERDEEADIQPGDMLIVDTSLRPAPGDVVITAGDADDFTARLYSPRRSALRLVGSDDQQMPEGDVFGVVTFNVRRARQGVRERQGAA